MEPVGPNVLATVKSLGLPPADAEFHVSSMGTTPDAAKMTPRKIGIEPEEADPLTARIPASVNIVHPKDSDIKHPRKCVLPAGASVLSATDGTAYGFTPMLPFC